MRSTTIKGIYSVVFIALVLAPSFAFGSKHPDIVGYRTPKNTWTLGTNLDDIDLDGFADSTPLTADTESYVDLRRTIQFDSEDTYAGIMLVGLHDELAALVITIDSEEKSFRGLKKYYRERYGSLEDVADEPDMISWMDDDGDVVSVIKTIAEDGEIYSSVVYMSADLVSLIAGDTTPKWIKKILDTYQDV